MFQALEYELHAQNSSTTPITTDPASNQMRPGRRL